MKGISNYLFILLTMLLFAGCKKDKAVSKKTQPENPKCQLTRFTEKVDTNALVLYEFTYDNKGQIYNISISENGYVTRNFNYTYSGNKVILQAVIFGVLGYKATFTKSANGELTPNIRVDYYTSSGSSNGWVNYAFSYNGNEVQQCVVTYSTATPGVTVNYTWSEGNVVSIISDENDVYLNAVYYTDKDYQAAGLIAQIAYPSDNYGFITAILYVIQNKNLAKTISFYSGTPETPNYIFDQDGKITSSTIHASGHVYEDKFQYKCN